jgi:hypothetical protein
MADASIGTFTNNKNKNNVIMYAIIGLVLIALGGVLLGSGSTPGMLGGGISIAMGAFFVYRSFSVLTDPANQRKCKSGYFTQIFTNMKVPPKWISGDVAVDLDLDVDEITAITKAQYDGYGGVFLVSNVSSDSIGGNYDAYYIPGNTKTILSSKVDPVNNPNKFTYGKLYVGADIKTNVRVTVKTDESDVSQRKDVIITGTPTSSQILYTPSSPVCPYS